MFSVTMKHERETKGAHLYNEIDSNGAILKTSDAACVLGNLYIRKAALAGKAAPATITVSIS